MACDGYTELAWSLGCRPSLRSVDLFAFHIPAQVIAQLIAGPIKQALGRLGREVELGSHFRIGVVAELVELHGDALPADKPGHRRAYDFGYFGALQRPGRCFAAVEQKPLCATLARRSQSYDRMPPTVAHSVAGDVLHNVKDPGTQSSLGLIPAVRTVETQEHLLSQILRFSPIPELAEKIANDPPAVRSDELSEGVGIAVPDPQHEQDLGDVQPAHRAPVGA